MTASLSAASGLKSAPRVGPPRPASGSIFPGARITPALIIGVVLAHAALVGLLLLTPDTSQPVTPPRPLMVSLIEPRVEAPRPQPQAEPRPPPPQPQPRQPKRAAKLSPPVLPAKPASLPLPQPTIDAAESLPEPALIPDVSPPTPTAKVEAPNPAPLLPATPTPPRPADYLSNPKPPYPALSKRRGEEGTVRLNILVNPDGSVAQLELAKSSGYTRLDRSAMETVQSRWKFEPARQHGRPVAAWVIVPIEFTLRS